ncbi:MAG TPA: SDR family NAD(P)-dependent oxidoreductase [Candidatus Thermoplasmatota archaeon]|nr:SDR family NAD(P)-dependent oxidoreductase [Candidatus Thermoplasmatota archaeon]
MARNIEGLAVVITGASSGIGRATALALADRGANLVLAARREEPLREVARACEERGVTAFPVPTDITIEGQVKALADLAAAELGRVDVWVNTAAVSAFGRFEDTPSDVFARVIETNLVAMAHCARAALPHLRESRGLFIPVASVLGKAAVPYLSAYNASKFGVVGLAESLRQEWEEEGVLVCTVMPPPTDTPFYEHAANYTGRTVRPPQPVYDAETVAEAIVDCIRHPRREVAVGVASNFQQIAHAVAPRTYERAAVPYIRRTMFEHDESAPPTEGNVFHPIPEGTHVEGGWKEEPDEE